MQVGFAGSREGRLRGSWRPDALFWPPCLSSLMGVSGGGPGGQKPAGWVTRVTSSPVIFMWFKRALRPVPSAWLAATIKADEQLTTGNHTKRRPLSLMGEASRRLSAPLAPVNVGSLLHLGWAGSSGLAVLWPLWTVRVWGGGERSRGNIQRLKGREGCTDAESLGICFP